MKSLPENIADFVDSLKKEMNLIIVEGKKDIKSLNELGIECTKISGPLKVFCEKTAENHKKVILLMDTNKEGGELTKKLKEYFSILGTNVNILYWRSLVKMKISHVGGLSKIYNKKINELR